MDFSQHTIWWILAAVLIALELATGTFYLLMLAVGAACGAIAAHLGAEPGVQVGAAAAAGVVACLLLRQYLKRSSPANPNTQADKNVNLDVGERVSVKSWSPENTSRTVYRGAEWYVKFDGDQPAEPGEHKIVALDGNSLVVKKVDSK